MNTRIIFITIALLLLIFFEGCTDVNEISYEPFYLNETHEDVSLIWGDSESGWFDTIKFIHPQDTAYCLKVAPTENTSYCTPQGNFPHLKKNGLHWSEKHPFYDVYLVFNTTPQKCLKFEGDKIQERDIRQFSSYENIGQCNFCIIRAMADPDAMLYRITEEMFNQAEPCE